MAHELNGVSVPKVKRTRDETRAAILSSENTKPDFRIVKFFGEDVELRQMDLATVLAVKESDSGNLSERIIRMMINYSYVPGTNEKVFEDGDIEALLSLPFGQDFARMQVAIGELTNINLATESAVGNSANGLTNST